jgi:hypothetical protein
MKRFNELVREIRDQTALASGGALDRPTSLYQAGAVGKGQRVPSQRPAAEPMMDAPGPRHHGRDADIDVVPGRRRPVVAPTQAAVSPRTLALRTMLATPRSLRTAIVIGEILGPPISMRDEQRRHEF